MIRDYIDGKADNIKYFIGDEVEKTCYYKQRTLFVADPNPDADFVIALATKHNCTHVYFGANQIFHTQTIIPILVIKQVSKKLNVTVDVPIERLTDVTIVGDSINVNVSVVIENVARFKNLSIKIDDRDFEATNKGVWIYNINDRDLTPWSDYKKDLILYEQNCITE